MILWLDLWIYDSVILWFYDYAERETVLPKWDGSIVFLVMKMYALRAIIMEQKYSFNFSLDETITRCWKMI